MNRGLPVLLGALLVASCGSDTPVTPTPTTYTLTVLAKDEAQVAVPGALVRILDGPNGGRTATTDQAGTATLTSLTPGGFTIEVTAAGYRTTTQGVTLTSPLTLTVSLAVVDNAAPVIQGLIAKGAVPNAPPNYSDAGEPMTVTATVTDPETPPEQLTYQWSATVGSFSGTGPTVTWLAGTAGGSSGTRAELTVTVIEKYGPSNSRENRATSNLTVVVHDSKKESGNLCLLFLTEFSNSSIKDPNYIVRNFSSSLCPDGKAEELEDVTENRATRVITSYSLGSPEVVLDFGGTCGLPRGDACVRIPCEWRSTVIATGKPEHVRGDCNLSTVYEQATDSWKLCWSTFSGVLLPSGRPFLGWRY